MVRTYHSQFGFEFELNAEPGRQHRLEASADLVDWSEIFSFSNTQPETTYVDQESAVFPQRFYRVVTP
jgi:hypothetical protein